MKIRIVYHQRLGDVIRVFPMARHLAKEGHEVFIECFKQYHGIFGAISYAKPIDPAEGELLRTDWTFDPQIWPARYDRFRGSGLSWEDFVYGLFPKFAGMDRRIWFDRMEQTKGLQHYGRLHGMALVCPFGYSQARHWSFEQIHVAARRVCKHPITFLVDEKQRESLLAHGIPAHDLLCVELADLPRVIAGAAEVFTVNSAPAIIAGAVRSEFYHVLSGRPQDDTICPASRVVTIGA